MAANTRTKAQIQSDRIEVARYYLQGKWQHEIASLVGRTQEMVSYDLRAVQKQWRDAPQQKITELKNKELAKIDELERTYWQAWEDSRKPKDITSTSKDGDRIKVGKRNEQRNGNPAFLRGVIDCIDRRCKLLGLDAPIKSEINNAIALTNEYKDMDAAELSRLYTATIRSPGSN